MGDRRILIFGGLGIIGGHLVGTLANVGCTVVPCDTLPSTTLEITIKIQETKPTHVVIAYDVGDSSTPLSSSDMYKVNVVNTLHTINTCKRKGIHCTYFGSASVYRRTGSHLFSEAHAQNNIENDYAMTKIRVENETGRYTNLLTLRVGVLLSSHYYQQNFIVDALNKLCFSSFPCSVTSLNDMIPIAVEMILRDAIGIYNFVNHDPVSQNEIMSAYKRTIDSKAVWTNHTLCFDTHQLSNDKLVDWCKVNKVHRPLCSREAVAYILNDIHKISEEPILFKRHILLINVTYGMASHVAHKIANDYNDYYITIIVVSQITLLSHIEHRYNTNIISIQTLDDIKVMEIIASTNPNIIAIFNGDTMDTAALASYPCRCVKYIEFANSQGFSGRIVIQGCNEIDDYFRFSCLLSAEMMSTSFAKNYGMQLSIVRCASVYGHNGGFVYDLCCAVGASSSETKLVIKTNSDSYVHMHDAVRAYIAILCNTKHVDMYGITADDVKSQEQVLVCVMKAVPIGISVTYDVVEDFKRRVKTEVNPSTLYNIHWKPTVPFENGLGTILKTEDITCQN